jgi:hypothetical protein
VATQCTHKWVDELVLEELAASLTVYRNVTPDLQVVELSIVESPINIWQEAKMMRLWTMCEEAGVRCMVHLDEIFGLSSITSHWMKRSEYEGSS